MITSRTKTQLVIFALITVIGVSYVGARYARLDRLFFDDTYTVVAHLDRSGGIFSGAEVAWRGNRIGQVGDMKLTDEGVDVVMDIDDEYDEIPADTFALVANRSAVGEQYVDLQPRVDDGPYLAEGSEIAEADTDTPIATEKLLADLSRTVRSVDRRDLRTVVRELGLAFDGTGQDLSTIIDTSNAFIETANANFDVTTALIKDANTVLNGQISREREIRSFARDLSLFSGVLAGNDRSLRAVIDNGSATADELRTFLEDNRVDLASLINNLVTTGEVVVKHLDGIEHVLVVYPYVVEGSYSVVAKDPQTGLYDAHFGLVLTPTPKVCRRGYEGTDERPAQDLSERPMEFDARCAEAATESNARGAQNAPRAGTSYGVGGGAGRAPIANYDPVTGTLRWGAPRPGQARAEDRPAPKSFGEEDWTWLYLQPMTASRR